MAQRVIPRLTLYIVIPLILFIYIVFVVIGQKMWLRVDIAQDENELKLKVTKVESC